MDSFFKKTILAGIGLFALTKEKVEEFVDDLIKKGEVTQDERAQFIKDTMDKVEQRTAEAKEWVTTQVEDTIEKLKPKISQQIDELSQKLDKMSAELEKLKKELNKQKSK